MYLCWICACEYRFPRCWKRVLKSLELELPGFVSQHDCLGQVLLPRAASLFNYWMVSLTAKLFSSSLVIISSIVSSMSNLCKQENLSKSSYSVKFGLLVKEIIEFFKSIWPSHPFPLWVYLLCIVHALSCRDFRKSCLCLCLICHILTKCDNRVRIHITY